MAKPKPTFLVTILSPQGQYTQIGTLQNSYFMAWHMLREYLQQNGDQSKHWDFNSVLHEWVRVDNLILDNFKGTGFYSLDFELQALYGQYNGQTSFYAFRIREVGHYSLEQLRKDPGFMNAFDGSDREIIWAEDAYLKQVDKNMYLVCSHRMKRQLAFVDNNPEMSSRYWANWVLCPPYPFTTR
jgi:hypothetical protein